MRREITRLASGRLRFFIALGMLFLVGCRDRQGDWAAETAQEIEHVKISTVPRGGSVLSAPKPTRSDSSVRANWQIQSNMETASYFEWLKSQIGSNYHPTSETGSLISFAKQGEGDRYGLEIRTKTSTNPAGTVYEASFVAAPD